MKDLYQLWTPWKQEIGRPQSKRQLFPGPFHLKMQVILGRQELSQCLRDMTDEIKDY